MNVYDTYFTDNYLLTVTARRDFLVSAGEVIKEKGIWIVNPWGPEILTQEEMKLPHEITIIDKNTIKVTKNGKTYLYKPDFVNQRVDITEQN